MIQADTCSKQQAVCFGQGFNDVLGEFVAFQCNDIHTTRTSWLPFGEHEGWNVLQNAAHTPNKGVASDGDEVMDRHGAGK